MEKSKIDEILGSLGFGLPENEIEIKAFDESFRNYRFEADETKINSEEILKNLRPKIKPTNIDFHRRTVLAAEIVFKLHKENTLGHLKLQKLIYLCQHSAQMNLHTNFLKQNYYVKVKLRCYWISKPHRRYANCVPERCSTWTRLGEMTVKLRANYDQC